MLDDEDLLEDSDFAIFYSYLSQLIMLALGITIYRFLLYPLFYNYIPRMLNKIIVGLVLVILLYCMCAVVGELLVCNSLTNTTCLFFHSEMFNVSSNGGWWILGPLTFFHVGFVLSFITILEFVWAQSPRPFCGLFTGLALMSMALSAFIGYGICKIVSIITCNAHGWFYSNLSVAFIIFCVLCVVSLYFQAIQVEKEG